MAINKTVVDNPFDLSLINNNKLKALAKKYLLEHLDNGVSKEEAVPLVEEQIEDFYMAHVSDKDWRINSGYVYQIKDKEGKIVPFSPNKQQLDLLNTQWYRNTILKARQI